MLCRNNSYCHGFGQDLGQVLGQVVGQVLGLGWGQGWGRSWCLSGDYNWNRGGWHLGDGEGVLAKPTPLAKQVMSAKQTVLAKPTPLAKQVVSA